MAGSGQRIFNDEKVTKSFHKVDQNGAEQPRGCSRLFPTPWAPTGPRSRNSLQNPAGLRSQNFLVRMSSKSITFCSSEWSFQSTFGRRQARSRFDRLPDPPRSNRMLLKPLQFLAKSRVHAFGSKQNSEKHCEKSLILNSWIIKMINLKSSKSSWARFDQKVTNLNKGFN